MGGERTKRSEKMLFLYYLLALIVLHIIVLMHVVVRQTTFAPQDKITDWINVVSSIVALVVSVFALVYLKRAFEVGHTQAKLAVSTFKHAVEKSIHDSRPVMRILDSPPATVVFDDHKSNSSLKFFLKNVGRSTALNVTTRWVSGAWTQTKAWEEFERFRSEAGYSNEQTKTWSDVLPDEKPSLKMTIPKTSSKISERGSELFVFIVIEYSYNFGDGMRRYALNCALLCIDELYDAKLNSSVLRKAIMKEIDVISSMPASNNPA